MAGLSSPLRAVAVSLACLFFTPDAFAQQPAEPPAVVVQRIAVEDIKKPEEFTARVEAIDSVDIRARVEGFLRSIDFQPGQQVKVNDPLFNIEPDQFEAQLASAKAELERTQATLTSATQALKRTQELFVTRTISQAAMDTAQENYDIAAANVAAAQAAVDLADLNVSYTRIKAPIAGVISKSNFSVGSLVSASSGPLARIVSLDPLRVAFSLAEGTLITFRQQETLGELPPKLDLSLRLANGTIFKGTGKLEYVDSEVNPQTGTVTVRAIFDNPRHVLVPGQFVTLIAEEKNAPRLPVVPQTAVLRDKIGPYVYVLGADDVVSIRRIELGPQVETGWAVTKGLSGDEQVVVQGVQRLREGIKVRPTEGTPVGDMP
ncbi:efflux RND transporter periplasmic adaptor subunit [Kaistia granuli]|uniref:efflux RND transporter periplasmic adaptor subunit n=1 Tax=Kaistia granuli TaxID=363259 RepID=UPI000367B8B5|nr:efflux RND transporter periplasmic adaptor subunit [Kaistia granuli]